MQIRLGWWLLLYLLLLSRPALALDGQTWVVAIGNDVGAGRDTTLLYAQRDARQVGDALRRHAQVPGHRITYLLDENATNVRRALIEINAAIRTRANSGERTTLVVFYSGHADAEGLHLGGSELPMDELRGLVESSAAKVRLLIVDACRSGNVTRVKGMSEAASFAVQLEGESVEGLAIISSSAAGESSQESDRLQASFFSHHFVNALRGAADRDGDGQVTLSEAYDYTYTQTLRSSGRTLALQHPTYAYHVKGRSELVLSTPGEGKGGSLKLAQAGAYLISESGRRGAVVAELETLRDGALLELPAGRYQVQRRSADEYREYEIEIDQGRTSDLADHEYASLRYDRLVRERGGTGAHVHGLNLLLGAKGPVIEGEGSSPQLIAGYGADLPWFSVGVRLRGSRVESQASELDRVRGELGAGIVLQRFVDLSWASFAFGVWVEGAWIHQSVTGRGQTQQRDSGSFSVAALVAVERSLGRGFSLRLEGGPITTQLRLASTDMGEQVGSSAEARLTYWASGGMAWRY